MCFFVSFSFNNGSFPLKIPAFHLLLSSSSLRSCAHFSHRSVKLRSTIATSNRVTFVIRAAGFPLPHPEDSSSEENLQGKERPQKQQGSSSADSASSEGKTSSFRPSSTSSSPTLPSTSSSNSATITFTFQSNGGNQLAASCSSSASHVQSCSCDNAGSIQPSGESSPVRFKKLSHMSKGIKAAFGVFEGWKVIQNLHTPEAVLLSGAGSWVLLSVKATKFFAKGLKMSQKVLTSSPWGKFVLKSHPDRTIIEKLLQNDLPSLAKGFNAFYAAIKIAQFSRSFGKESQEGNLPDARIIWKGYKFSKSLVSILDVVAGKNGWALSSMGKGFVIVKKTMGGIGVMEKAVFLSKELGTVVLKRIAISGGTFAAVFGLRHQTSNQNSPTIDELQQSKSKEFLCMTLVNEGYLGDLASAAFRTGLFKDESLLSLFLLVRSFIEDSESVYSEEDDLTPIFCLALPLPIREDLYIAAIIAVIQLQAMMRYKYRPFYMLIVNKNIAMSTRE